MYTVKQLSDLAGVSVRTLHYYDEIGLLAPSSVSENGYRFYDEGAALRLQQILFYRELGVGLLQIREILDNPAFDLLAALQAHRGELEKRVARLQALMQTVDSTIMHLTGAVQVSDSRLFEAFSEAKQAEYEQQAAELWGEASVQASAQRWKSYPPERKQAILVEGSTIYADLAAAMQHGLAPDAPEVEAIMARWHNHLRYFYEPTPDILRGLGQLYNEHPDFIATFRQFHPNLPAYLQQAVAHYVDVL